MQRGYNIYHHDEIFQFLRQQDQDPNERMMDRLREIRGYRNRVIWPLQWHQALEPLEASESEKD